jgi:hypothetical protein
MEKRRMEDEEKWVRISRINANHASSI